MLQGLWVASPHKLSFFGKGCKVERVKCLSLAAVNNSNHAGVFCRVYLAHSLCSAPHSTSEAFAVVP